MGRAIQTLYMGRSFKWMPAFLRHLIFYSETLQSSAGPFVFLCLFLVRASMSRPVFESECNGSLKCDE
jgi:hypothetical protein